MTQLRLRPGDLIEVRAPEEILQTLDAEGTLDQLPFMPEMLGFCGRRIPRLPASSGDLCLGHELASRIQDR